MDTGNNLLVALDPHDSVGILDQYFPKAHFFTEFERFDRHCEKLRRSGTPIDYVTVCSPNYLHDAHIRFGLRIGADVICEKPVVLNPWNVEALLEMEKETGKKVFAIHQLRLHPAILALKEKIQHGPSGKKYTIDLTYITPRGNWYQHSWKGDQAKSGGIGSNIGLHFFDMLLWIFGDVNEIQIVENSEKTISGTLMLTQATIHWHLSIDENLLHETVKNRDEKFLRSLTIDGEIIDFSSGFDELHTRSYEQVLKGGGLHLHDTLKGIELVHRIRNWGILPAINTQ